MANSGSRAQRKLERARTLKSGSPDSRQSQAANDGAEVGIRPAGSEAEPVGSTGTPDLPNRTEAPGSELRIYHLSDYWDATVAPEVGVPEETQGEFVESVPGLLDKYLFSQLKTQHLILMIPLVPMVWIFVQDNVAGRLETIQGVLWWLAKSGIALLVCAVFLLFAALLKRR